MKILKKTGSILFCLLPFLLALGIQLLVTVAGLVLRIIYMIQQDPSLVNELSSPAFLMELTGNSQFLAGLSAAYAVIAALVMGFWYRKRFVPNDHPYVPDRDGFVFGARSCRRSGDVAQWDYQSLRTMLCD